MVPTHFGSGLILLTIGVCLLHSTLAGDEEDKRKKVIIKVPQVIKHIHHHHVKKVHVYDEEPKKEFNYGPFYHHHSGLTATKGSGGWASGHSGISTQAAWKLPKTADGWNSYFKKAYESNNLEGHGKNIGDNYGGGEPWKENDDSFGYKASEDWENTWGDLKSGSGFNGGYESNSGGAYDDVSHVMYEMPFSSGSSGHLGEDHEQVSSGSFGESSFDGGYGGYGGSYKLHKRENRGPKIDGTNHNHNNFMYTQAFMRQPEVEHVYEMEDDKHSDWIHDHEVASSSYQKRNIAELERLLLMQKAGNSRLRSYLNGRYGVTRSAADWMPFKGE